MLHLKSYKISTYLSQSKFIFLFYLDKKSLNAYIINYLMNIEENVNNTKIVE